MPYHCQSRTVSLSLFLLSLSLPCLWPFALCTSNGWGVIHWLICWQPVWQGISFVSLLTMLLHSVCVCQREGERVSEKERRKILNVSVHIHMRFAGIRTSMCDWVWVMSHVFDAQCPRETWEWCRGPLTCAWPLSFPFLPLFMSIAALFSGEVWVLVNTARGRLAKTVRIRLVRPPCWSSRHPAMSNRAQFSTKYCIFYYFHYNNLGIIAFLSAEALKKFIFGPKDCCSLGLQLTITINLIHVFFQITQSIV